MAFSCTQVLHRLAQHPEVKSHLAQLVTEICRAFALAGLPWTVQEQVQHVSEAAGDCSLVMCTTLWSHSDGEGHPTGRVLGQLVLNFSVKRQLPWTVDAQFMTQRRAFSRRIFWQAHAVEASVLQALGTEAALLHLEAHRFFDAWDHAGLTDIADLVAEALPDALASGECEVLRCARKVDPPLGSSSPA